MRAAWPAFVLILNVFLWNDVESQLQPTKTKPPAMKNTKPETQRYCLTLDLKDDPELIKEYKHWHQSKNIWPEIPRGIKEVGILDMEIYLFGTRMVMIMETKQNFDFDRQMKKLSQLPRQKEWEAFVGKFQRPLPTAKPGEKWMLMEKVFKLQ